MVHRGESRAQVSVRTLLVRHTSLTCAKPPFLKQDFLSVSLYAGEGEVTKSS